MRSFKGLCLIIIGIYVIAQVISIIILLSGPRIVTVYRENYREINTVIKPYQTENTPIEVFEMRVKPNGFWDELLLTRDDENVLVDIFKMASGLVFAWYFFKQDYDNIFSNRSRDLFFAGLFLCTFNYITFGVGADHTRDFCSALFAPKKGDDTAEIYFKSQIKSNTITHDYWIYVWVPMILINFYKTFNRHHQGKPEEGWFGEDVLEENKKLIE